VKAEIKREQNDACIDSAEREQARPETKAEIKREQNDACIDSAEREQARPETNVDCNATLGSVRERFGFGYR